MLCISKLYFTFQLAKVLQSPSKGKENEIDTKVQ